MMLNLWRGMHEKIERNAMTATGATGGFLRIGEGVEKDGLREADKEAAGNRHATCREGSFS
jgi:hypothetical protein